MKPRTKMIKVTSRGWVTTSRGQVYAPIIPAYREELGVIFHMLARENAKVVEILRDGSECELTIQNFDKNNEPVKPIDPKPVVENPAPPIFQDNSASVPAVVKEKTVDVKLISDVDTTPDVAMAVFTGLLANATQKDLSETNDSENETNTDSANNTSTETSITIDDPGTDTIVPEVSGDMAVDERNNTSTNKPNPVIERFNNGEKRHLSKSERRRLRNQQKNVDTGNTENDAEPIE